MRNLAQAVLDELGKDEIGIAILGEFEFLSGTQNLWIGPSGHQLSYDSKTWTALTAAVINRYRSRDTDRAHGRAEVDRTDDHALVRQE